jgi:hypothetical protein
MVVLIVSLVATTGLTLVLGLTDPAPPLSYPTRFFVWNLVLAWIPVFAARLHPAHRPQLARSGRACWRRVDARHGSDDLFDRGHQGIGC